MKTKYFEFSKNGGSEKYSEFTEAEYLKAKEEENRWFIALVTAFWNAMKASILTILPRRITENIRKRIETGRRSSPSHWSSIHTAEITSRRFSMTVQLFRLRSAS